MNLSLEDRITQLEAQIRVLTEQESDLHQLLDANGDVFWLQDIRSGQTRYVGAGYERLYGIPVEAQLADPLAFLAVVHPDDLPAVKLSLAQQAQGQHIAIEYRVSHHNGSLRWIASRSIPIRNQHGELVRTVGVASDITSRKHAQEAAEHDRRLLRAIIDLLPDSIYAKDLERRKTLANRIDMRYMGVRTMEEVLGKRDEDTYPPEVAARFREVEERLLESARPVLNQMEWLTLDGQDICLLSSKVPLHNEAGEVVGLVGIGRDITELRKAQLALEELNHSLEARIEERTHALRVSEQRLRQVIDLAPYAIYAKDIEGRYVLANNAAAASLGMLPEQIIGKRDLDVSHNIAQAGRFYAQDLQVIETGAPLLLPEETIYFHDGSEHIFRTVKLPMAVAENEKPVVLGVGIDITDLKQTEAALRSAEAELRRSHEQLQAAYVALHDAARLKDDFMATMSHELRTPLSSILGLADALQSTALGPLTERQAHALKVVEESGRELLALINDLLELSRIEAGQLHLQIEVFDAVSLAKIAVTRSAAAADKKQQRIQFDAPSEPILIEGDQRRYLQIVLNLLNNAIKFTPETGKLGIILERDLAASIGRITVWDEGIGIDEEDLDRLFRPFTQLDSTIRRSYSGVGLGLALTKRLVEIHGGNITVQSSPGSGSRFIVTLPCKA